MELPVIKEIVYQKYRTLRRSTLKSVEGLSPSEQEFRQVYPLIDPIEGLLKSPRQEKWLFKSARALPKDSIIVEIGSFKGRSTASLAFGCRKNGSHVYAIDTFNGNKVDFFERAFLPVFQSNMDRCGLTDYVTPLVGFSEEVVKTWNKPIHMLFIDGSHKYEDVLADFESFYPFVVPGGKIAFHDVHPSWPGVVRVWQENAIPRLSRVYQVSNLAYGIKR
jgi:predicted O-methyltransferase YrrM